MARHGTAWHGMAWHVACHAMPWHGMPSRSRADVATKVRTQLRLGTRQTWVARAWAAPLGIYQRRRRQRPLHLAMCAGRAGATSRTRTRWDRLESGHPCPHLHKDRSHPCPLLCSDWAGRRRRVPRRARGPVVVQCGGRLFGCLEIASAFAMPGVGEDESIVPMQTRRMVSTMIVVTPSFTLAGPGVTGRVMSPTGCQCGATWHHAAPQGPGVLQYTGYYTRLGVYNGGIMIYYQI